MKTNATTRILGKNVILVPYKVHHVSKYHEWMKSKELQYLTGSEPLTLEEEYAMQSSWHDAEDKCTFIILDKAAFEKDRNEIESMIGDTNLFFNDVEHPHTAEAEIMIAEPIARGKRMGWEAVILMLRYGIEELKVKQFCVKITMDNERSIKMFKKLGFIEVGRSDVFREVTMEKKVQNDWLKWLIGETHDSFRDQEYK